MGTAIRTAIMAGSIALCTVLPAHSQTDGTAGTLLRKVSEVYDGYKTLRAEFSVKIIQPHQTANHSESGMIYVDRRSGKYRITTSGQDIISDGNTQWSVLKDVGEVQITDVDPTADVISPTNIFSFYERGYKYVSSADERAGGTQLAVVELTPEDASSPYFKIKLRIDQQTHQIYDVNLFDKGGNRFVYTIKHTKANPQLAADRFVFDPADYPGVEVVDLR